MAHFHVVALASEMYQDDYDGCYMPVNYQPGQTLNSRGDRTWVQMLLPYTPSFKVFECPADESDRPRMEATFDQDLVPGDLYSQYYTASIHSNVGYNFQYLSPIFLQNGVWQCQPQVLQPTCRPRLHAHLSRLGMDRRKRSPHRRRKLARFSPLPL